LLLVLFLLEYVFFFYVLVDRDENWSFWKISAYPFISIIAVMPFYNTFSTFSPILSSSFS